MISIRPGSYVLDQKTLSRSDISVDSLDAKTRCIVSRRGLVPTIRRLLRMRHLRDEDAQVAMNEQSGLRLKSKDECRGNASHGKRLRKGATALAV